MSFFDITDRDELEQAIHDQVLTDPLTGLANRFAAQPATASRTNAATSAGAMPAARARTEAVLQARNPQLSMKSMNP